MRLKSSVAVLMLAGLMIAQTGCGRSMQGSGSPDAKSVTKASALLMALTPDELRRDAPVIIRARVEGPIGTFTVVSPSGDDREPGSTQSWIYTEWSVVPTKVYKNDGTISVGKPITVALRGGQAGDEVIDWDSEAELTQGEDVVLCLGPSDGEGTEAAGRYFTYQLLVGKYRIDKKSGMAINKDNRRNIKFTDLESKLK